MVHDRQRTRRLRWRSVAPTLLLIASGCGVVPRRELDDARQVAQNLRSENGRLKNEALTLRSQLRDGSERAVDDARKIAQLEAENQRFEQSVLGYQQDREKLATEFDRIKAGLREPAPRQARRD